VAVPSTRRLFASSLVCVSLLFASAASAQSELTRARDLYRAAAYDDALAVLNPLHSSPAPAADGPMIEEYRALCLIALGRSTEAVRAMEAAVTMAPAYHLSFDETPPRVRATFADVRRRVLPGIIQQKYADAKAAYDRKDPGAAAAGFKQVLDAIEDPDLAAVASAPPLANLRALAIDFRRLSEAAAAPPPALPSLAPPRVVEPPPVPARPAAPRIYGPEDTNVVPPTTVRQVLPPVGEVFAVRQGVVEVIISETGAVESATMRSPVNPVYDRLVLSAAKNWRFQAATLDGTPVKFRKIVQIDIKSR
jgi:TonB family protein